MSKREIEFRGKRVDNGEWIEGYFLPGNERQSLHPCIFVYLPETQSFECFDINIDTLGEYTGLTDRDGTRIFEGDIVNARWFGKVERAFVCYAEDYLMWVLKYSDDEHNDMNLFFKNDLKVIGNIYDNPELLKGE